MHHTYNYQWFQCYKSFIWNCWNKQKYKWDPSTEGCNHCYICPEGLCFSYIFLLHCKIRSCLSCYWLFWNLFDFSNSWRTGSSWRIRPTIFFLFFLPNTHLVTTHRVRNSAGLYLSSYLCMPFDVCHVTTVFHGNTRMKFLVYYQHIERACSATVLAQRHRWKCTRKIL